MGSGDKKRGRKKKKRSGLILHKPSGSIAITGELSAAQRRLYNILLHVAQEAIKAGDTDRERFNVSVTTLQDLYKFAGTRNYEWLRDTVRALTQTNVRYNILEKDSLIRKDTFFNILSEATLTKHEEKGLLDITFALPPFIKEAIRRITERRGVYADIDLKVIMDLRSKYAMNLYELCRDYHNLGVLRMALSEFREILGVKGKYPGAKDLRKWVIEPAVKEINENPFVPFTVKYELTREQRTGKRGYTHIRLTIIPKESAAIPNGNAHKFLPLSEGESSENGRVRGEDDPLKTKGVKEILLLLPEGKRTKKAAAVIERAVAEKGREYVRAQVEYCVRMDGKKGIDNFPGYLKKAIEEDYAGHEVVSVEPDPEELLGKRVVLKGEKFVIRSIRKGDEENVWDIEVEELATGRVRYFSAKGLSAVAKTVVND